MPTYSTGLRIELQTTGENSGTWGTITNNNFSQVFEFAIAGVYAVPAITTGTSRLRREETIHQFRLILETPELAPEGLHKEDVLTAMATIVGFQDKMDALQGLTTPDAQAKRDALRAQYYRVLESFSNNKPWLNELFYSVFVPLIGESWLAKYDGGNININTGVLV